MASTEFTPLDSATCRILTVSSTLSCAVGLVDRVCNLRNFKPGEAATPTPEASTSTPAPTPIPEPHPSGLGESTRVPWTISNKYYSADVHFAAHTITGLAPHVVRNVPAVIFVWAKGEAYKHHVERLAGDVSGYEPEVALAVRVAALGDAEAGNEDDDDEEEDAEIDEFLSSNGFEFVDASEETPVSEDPEEYGSFSQGIPGLPRVLDALSTIMWPSMQAQAPKASGLPKLARRDFDWAQNSQDDLSPIGGLGHAESKQQEMEVLTRWLEEDDGVLSREDPWRSAADSAAIATSPTALNAPDSPPFPAGGKEFGFDDDFTVFVSAPVVPEEATEDLEDESFDSPTERLGPPEASPLYLSLGSALDLREVDEAETEAADEEDEDLPTDAEIEAMSSRIFGGPVRGKADTDVESKSHAPLPEAVPQDAGGDDEYDMAPFDLSRVMSALEGMKAEIASMEDEGERRKAAARVALGLVYGLEADAGADSL
ncbi:hypothetical protein C8R43DRAFT_1011638 [Mycena crocata]|nr:hypothetical protein C8R43DRAFT_1011638 [Mycena crocata]